MNVNMDFYRIISQLIFKFREQTVRFDVDVCLWCAYVVCVNGCFSRNRIVLLSTMIRHRHRHRHLNGISKMKCIERHRQIIIHLFILACFQFFDDFAAAHVTIHYKCIRHDFREKRIDVFRAGRFNQLLYDIICRCINTKSMQIRRVQAANRSHGLVPLLHWGQTDVCFNNIRCVFIGWKTNHIVQYELKQAILLRWRTVTWWALRKYLLELNKWRCEKR